MLTVIVGIVGGLMAATGWFFAWRARGETNAAADRARIAETKIETANAAAELAQSGQATAVMQLKAAAATVSALKMNLDKAYADKGDLLEKLAKAGVPVADDMYDSITSRLYANRDRGASGPVSGSGGDPPTLPGSAAPAAVKTSTN